MRSVLVVTCVLLALFSLGKVSKAEENEFPVVGILCQEVYILLEELNPGHKCYIAASYVKFVESGGARVVPLMIGENRSYYEEMLGQLNGVMLPGGEAPMGAEKGYSEALGHIYQIAKGLNDKGVYFPLWGHCLGFETLIYHSNDKVQPRTPCFAQRQSVPLVFKEEAKTSRLYGKAPTDVLEKLSSQAITSNFHVFCITEASMIANNLTKDWRILSTNTDRIRLSYISSVEHIKYPFYGLQFHPEKNIFEWVRGRRLSHTEDAILANRYFGEFFNREVRKNNQSFESESQLSEKLIYNYQTFNSGRAGKGAVVYQQVYLFD